MKTKIKTVTLKENLVALTGDPIAAMILSQMLYWSERTRDTDKYLEEELRRANGDSSCELTNGWIYKSAEELSEELMGIASSSTISRRLRQLVKSGWLGRRNNPNHKWDRTLQYRPNIVKIQSDLLELGYVLDGYPLQIDATILQSEKSKTQNARALPETTTETTTNNCAEGAQQSTDQQKALEDFIPRLAERPPSNNGKSEFRVPEGMTPDEYAKFRVGETRKTYADRIRGKWGVSSDALQKALDRHPEFRDAALRIGKALDEQCGLAPVWGDVSDVKSWGAGLIKLARLNGDPSLFVRAYRKLKESGMTIGSPFSLFSTARDLSRKDKSGGIKIVL
jgi:hypothetical protein